MNTNFREMDNQELMACNGGAYSASQVTSLVTSILGQVTILTAAAIVSVAGLISDTLAGVASIVSASKKK